MISLVPGSTSGDENEDEGTNRRSLNIARSSNEVSDTKHIINKSTQDEKKLKTHVLKSPYTVIVLQSIIIVVLGIFLALYVSGIMRKTKIDIEKRNEEVLKPIPEESRQDFKKIDENIGEHKGKNRDSRNEGEIRKEGTLNKEGVKPVKSKTDDTKQLPDKTKGNIGSTKTKKDVVEKDEFIKLEKLSLYLNLLKGIGWLQRVLLLILGTILAIGYFTNDGIEKDEEGKWMILVVSMYFMIMNSLLLFYIDLYYLGLLQNVVVIVLAVIVVFQFIADRERKKSAFDPLQGFLVALKLKEETKESFLEPILLTVVIMMNIVLLIYGP